MLVNHFNFVLRRAKSKKISSLLYFTLLFLGFSSFAILISTIVYEKSFDGMFDNKENIYRVTTHFTNNTKEIDWALSNGYLSQAIPEEIPEVQFATKIFSIRQKSYLKSNERSILLNNTDGLLSDSSFFKIFSFQFREGNKNTALLNPNSIVITEDLAKIIFGKKPAMGKTILYDNYLQLKVTGVLKNIPTNSHLQFKYLISGNSGNTFKNLWNRSNDPIKGGYTNYVYFKSSNIANEKNIQAKIDALVKKKYPHITRTDFSFLIQPLSDIYFGKDLTFDIAKKGNILLLRIMLIISVIILLVCSINFTLLFTLGAFDKIKEFGIRLSSGASQSDIFARLFIESSFFIVPSAMLSSLPLFLFADTFPNISQIPVEWKFIIISIIIISGVVIAIGSALYVLRKTSSYSIINIINNESVNSKYQLYNSKNLLIFIQFILTFSLLLLNEFISNQLEFVANKDLGFKQKEVINVQRLPAINSTKFTNFYASLESIPGISAGSSLYEFVSDYNSMEVTYHSLYSDSINLRCQWNMTDHNLFPALEMNFIQGTNFPRTTSAKNDKVILNKEAYEQLGEPNIIGKYISNKLSTTGKSEIIGVIENYHFQSLYSEIKPLIIFEQNPNWGNSNILISIESAEKYRDKILQIKNLWNEASLEIPFEYELIESKIQNKNLNDIQLSSNIKYFSYLTIIFSIFGLFGLIRHMFQIKKKEFALRMIFGASFKDILRDTLRVYMIFIIPSFVLSIPISMALYNFYVDKYNYIVDFSIIQIPLLFIIVISICLLLILSIVLGLFRKLRLMEIIH